MYHSAAPVLFPAPPGARYGHSVPPPFAFSPQSVARPGLGLSRREREAWDLLQGPLMQAHLSPAQARAVIQVILDGADLGRCFRDPAYRFRAVVDAGREANVHRAANIDPVSLGARQSDRDVHTTTADNSSAWTGVIHPLADALVSAQVSYGTCAFQGGITAEGVGCASNATIGGGNCRHHEHSGASQRMGVFGSTNHVPPDWSCPPVDARATHIAELERQVADLTASLIESRTPSPSASTPVSEVEQLEREVRDLTEQISASAHHPSPRLDPPAPLDAMQGTPEMPSIRMHQVAPGLSDQSGALRVPEGTDEHALARPQVLVSHAPPTLGAISAPAPEQPLAYSSPVGATPRPVSPTVQWYDADDQPRQPSTSMQAPRSSGAVLLAERRKLPWVPKAPGQIPKSQYGTEAIKHNSGSIARFEEQLSAPLGVDNQGFLELPLEPPPDDPDYDRWLGFVARVYGNHGSVANQGRYAWEEELALRVGLHMLSGPAATAVRRAAPSSYRQLISALRAHEGERPTALSRQQQRLELLNFTVKPGVKPLKVMEYFVDQNEAIEAEHGFESRVAEADFVVQLLSRKTGFYQETRYRMQLEIMFAEIATGGVCPSVSSLCYRLHDIWKSTRADGKDLLAYIPGVQCPVCTRDGHDAIDCFSHWAHEKYRGHLPRSPAHSAAVMKWRSEHAEQYRKADERLSAARGGDGAAKALQELQKQGKLLAETSVRLSALLDVDNTSSEENAAPPRKEKKARRKKKKTSKLGARAAEAGSISSLMMMPFMLFTMMAAVLGGSAELLRAGNYTSTASAFASGIDDVLFNGIPAGSSVDVDPDYPVMWDSGYTGSALMPTIDYVQDATLCSNIISLGDGQTPIVSTHSGDVYYRMVDASGTEHVFVRQAEVNPSVPFPIFGTHAENHRGGGYTGDRVSLDAVPTLTLRSGQEFFGCYSRGMPWMPAALTTPTDAERQALELVRVGCGVAHVSVGDLLHATMTPTPQRRGKRRVQSQPAGAIRSLQLGGDEPAPRSSARVRARLEAVVAATNVVATDVAEQTAVAADVAALGPDVPAPDADGLVEPAVESFLDTTGGAVTVGSRVSIFWPKERAGPTSGVFIGTVTEVGDTRYSVRYPEGEFEHLRSDVKPMRLTLVVRPRRSQARGTSADRSTTAEPRDRPRGRNHTSFASARHREAAPSSNLRNASASILSGREVRFSERRKQGWRRIRPVRAAAVDPWSNIAHQLHVQWGHCSMETVVQACRTMGIDIPQADLDRLCRDCAVTKGRRQGRRRGLPVVPEPPPEHYGDRLCADIVHERVESTKGNKYWLLVVDEKGRYPYTCPLRKKSDAVGAFRQYCRRHLGGRQTPGTPQRPPQDPADTGRPQTLLKTDNDTVFLSAEFEEQVLNEYNIRLRCGRPNARNDNLICERMVQTIRGRKDTMLESSSMQVQLWEHALRWSTYLTALLPTKALGGISPHHDVLGQQGLSEQAYVLGRAVPFGTTAYAYNHGRGNHDPKAKIGVFVGVNPVSLCPMLLKEDNGMVVETADCRFVLETSFGHPYSRQHPTAYHYHDDPAETEVCDHGFQSDSSTPSSSSTGSDGGSTTTSRDTSISDNEDNSSASSSGSDSARSSSGSSSSSDGGSTTTSSSASSDTSISDSEDNSSASLSAERDDTTVQHRHPNNAGRPISARDHLWVDSLAQEQILASSYGLTALPAQASSTGTTEQDSNNTASEPAADHNSYTHNAAGDDMLLHLAQRCRASREARAWAPDQGPQLGPTRDGFDTPGMSVPDGTGDHVHMSSGGGFADTRDPPVPSRYAAYPDDDSGAFFAALATGRTPPPGTTARPKQRVPSRAVCGIKVPRSYAEAHESPEWSTVWKPAFDRERDNIRGRGIWRFAKSGTAASRGHYQKIRVHLIWDIKRDDDGNFLKGKCRAVADGSRMQRGTHWHQSASPVVRPAMVRTIAALAAGNGWRRRTCDVVGAYLWADLDCEVWATVPESMLEDHEIGADCLIVKSQYGLIQAGLLWYCKLRMFFLSLGYRQSAVDPCVYYKWRPRTGPDDKTPIWQTCIVDENTTDPLDPYSHGAEHRQVEPHPTLDTHHVSIIGVHVDDVIAVSSDDLMSTPLSAAAQNMTTGLFDALHSEYEITRDDNGLSFTGCRHRDVAGGGVTIDQNVYVQDVVSRAQMDEPRTTGPKISVPMDPKTKLRPATEREANTPENAEAQSFPYRRHAASHLYHACMTRPGDSYAAAKLCRYMSAHDHEHVRAMQRFTRYVRDNAQQCLRYGPQPASTQNVLHAASDASLGDEHDGRSTMGFAIWLNGAAVDWKTGVMKEIAWGTPYTEFVSASEGARGTVVLATFLGEVGFPQGPCQLRMDCEPARALADRAAPTPLGRYVAQRYHYLRQCVHEHRSIVVVECPSTDMDVDALTKPLTATKWRRCTDRLNGSNPRVL